MLDWDEIKREGWKPKSGDSLRILSIDGRGIRGLFPTQYLTNIEEATGKHINEFFDLIVGTSTGGIIALGLSVGIPARQIAELYEDKAKEIFKPTLSNKIFKKFGMIFENSYTNKDLINLLKSTFEGKKMRDADVMLCITSVDHNNAKPKVYKTPHDKKYHWDEKLDMWEIAQATSAAPLYFPPANEDGYKLDGGLWANNPVLVGITEALHHGIKLENIKILSIGTGQNLYSGDDSIFKFGGLMSWKTNILEVFMSAQSYSAENIAKQLIKEDNLIRINFTSSKKIGLDSVDDSVIKELKCEANNSFKETFRNNQNVEKKFFEI